MTEPRNLYVATCETTGKRSYAKRTTAKKVARSMPGGGLATYRCPDCNHWHIGHRSTWTRAEHRDHRAPTGNTP